jgi:N-acetylglucosamine kinase-like BadF-type ATPase
MPYYLGIEGGGTRTTACLASERRRIVACSASGPSNPLKVGFDSAQQQILLAARRVLREVRLRPGELKAVCVGLAGVDRPQVHRRLFDWLQRSIPARFHYLTSDAAIALEAALGDLPGLVIISGTGSIAYARGDDGRMSRSGGWGHLFDDAGGGYDLGRKGIIAALRASDGRGPQTVLRASICRVLGLKDITEIVAHSLAPHEIAALFPLVLKAAARRDSVAQRLCEEASHELADLGLSLLRRLKWNGPKVRIAAVGGVFQASIRIRRSFKRRIISRVPRVQIVFSRRAAVEGALALAWKLAEGRLSQDRVPIRTKC